MAEQQQPQGEPTPDDCTVMMEDILDKLKLLNYEKEFVQKSGLKPLNRAYFAIAIQPTEQFNYFKNLIKWLLTLNQVQSQDYNKFDDPITVASNLQFQLKQINIECDWPPIKLKSGSGPQVCQVVQDLVTRALQIKKFSFKRPNIIASNKQGPTQEENEIDEDANDQINDNDKGSVASDDDPEENLGAEIGQRQEIDEDKAIIETKINAREWQIECERVAPKLNIVLKSDAKEWRAHIEQTKNLQENIKKILPDSRNRLEKISDSLSKVLDTISKREKSINSSMTDLGGEYQEKSDRLKKIVAQYNNLNNAVKEMSEQYRQLTEKYETIQTKTNEQGNISTDSSPLVRIKAAIQKLKEEIKSMDLRIGVLQHTILQHRLRAKKYGDYIEEGNEIDEFGNQNLDELDFVN